MNTPTRGRGSLQQPEQRRPDGTKPGMSKAAASKIDPHRKKILLMGHKRSGKTACKEVAFHEMTAKETFLLEPTRTVTKENLDILIPIQVWDCPANYPIENLPILLGAFSTIIYVIDIQDDYAVPIHLLLQLMAQIYVETKDQPRPINLEVFVHKADGMSDDYKLEYFRHLQERIMEGCLDHDTPIQNITPTFHLTSAYDHTIFEAWSRTIQRLIDPLGTLENLMNVLCSNSSLTKAFLFDTKTLIHVASDDSPPDASVYGLCCEYVQTVMQFSSLYKTVEWELPHNIAPYRPENDRLVSDPSSPTRGVRAKPSLLMGPPSATTQSSSLVPNSPTSPKGDSTKSSLRPSSKAEASAVFQVVDSEKPRTYANSCVRLKPQTTLAYWEITDELSLVAVVRSETWEANQSLIDYNVTFFRKAIQKIVELENAKWMPIEAANPPGPDTKYEPPAKSRPSY